MDDIGRKIISTEDIEFPYVYVDLCESTCSNFLKHPINSTRHMAFFKVQYKEEWVALGHIPNLHLYFVGTPYFECDLVRMTNLRKLNLSYSLNDPWIQRSFFGIKFNVSKALFNMSFLHSLILSQNEISILPPEIKNLENIQELCLNFNKLTILPPEIGELDRLSKLELSANNLLQLPDSIVKLISLKELYLGNNKLTDLPDLNILYNLIKLDIRNNPLSQNCIDTLTTLLSDERTFPYLQVFLSSNQDLNELAQIKIEENKLRNSSILIYSDFPLTTSIKGSYLTIGLSNRGIQDLTGLNELLVLNPDVTKNWVITKISDLEGLYLDLSHNPISTQTLNMLVDLKNIETLNLSYCSLTDADIDLLEDVFRELPELSQIDLRGNKFSSAGMKDLAKIKARLLKRASVLLNMLNKEIDSSNSFFNFFVNLIYS